MNQKQIREKFNVLTTAEGWMIQSAVVQQGDLLTGLVQVPFDPPAKNRLGGAATRRVYWTQTGEYAYTRGNAEPEQPCRLAPMPSGADFAEYAAAQRRAVHAGFGFTSSTTYSEIDSNLLHADPTEAIGDSVLAKFASSTRGGAKVGAAWHYDSILDLVTGSIFLPGIEDPVKVVWSAKTGKALEVEIKTAVGPDPLRKTRSNDLSDCDLAPLLKPLHDEFWADRTQGGHRIKCIAINTLDAAPEPHGLVEHKSHGVVRVQWDKDGLAIVVKPIGWLALFLQSADLAQYNLVKEEAP